MAVPYVENRLTRMIKKIKDLKMIEFAVGIIILVVVWKFNASINKGAKATEKLLDVGFVGIDVLHDSVATEAADQLVDNKVKLSKVVKKAEKVKDVPRAEDVLSKLL